MSEASQRPRKNETIDVGADVHAARTAVAPLSMTVLEELRRAKMARVPSSFTNEAPTVPGKDGLRLLRPLAPDAGDVPPASPSESLAGAMIEALAQVSDADASAVETLPAPPLAPPVAVLAPAASIPPSVPTPAAMAAMSPDEARAPLARRELVVALAIVASTALVLALIAVAERFSLP